MLFRKNCFQLLNLRFKHHIPIENQYFYQFVKSEHINLFINKPETSFNLKNLKSQSLYDTITHYMKLLISDNSLRTSQIKGLQNYLQFKTNTMSAPEKLFILECFYQECLKHQIPFSTIYILERILKTIQFDTLTNDELVKLMFYWMNIRKLTYSLAEKDELLKKIYFIIPSLNIVQCSLLVNSFFKCNTVIKDQNVLLLMADKLIESLQNESGTDDYFQNNILSYVAVLKSLRSGLVLNSISQSRVEEIIRRISRLTKRVLETSLKNDNNNNLQTVLIMLAHTGWLAVNMQIRDSQFLSLLLSLFSREVAYIESMRLKDLAKIVWCLAHFNAVSRETICPKTTDIDDTFVKPRATEMFSQNLFHVLADLERPERCNEMASYIDQSLLLCYSLIMLKTYPKFELLQTLFDSVKTSDMVDSQLSAINKPTFKSAQLKNRSDSYLQLNDLLTPIYYSYMYDNLNTKVNTLRIPEALKSNFGKLETSEYIKFKEILSNGDSNFVFLNHQKFGKDYNDLLNDLNANIHKVVPESRIYALRLLPHNPTPLFYWDIEPTNSMQTNDIINTKIECSLQTFLELLAQRRHIILVPLNGLSLDNMGHINGKIVLRMRHLHNLHFNPLAFPIIKYSVHPDKCQYLRNLISNSQIPLPMEINEKRSF